MSVPASSTMAADETRGIHPSGYRLPAETRLGRVRLQVADLARSIAYYEQVIGLRVLDRVGPVARLAAHGDTRVLVELRERPGAAPASRRGRLGLYHFAILLPERAALGRFVRHLGEIGAYAGMSDHLVSEAVYLTDPDGLGIEVYADRPRSAWRYDGTQIEMATSPLNVQDLLRYTGASAWTGMPAGTVIGHVHLFVDSLDEAARFYHEGLGLDKVVWNYPGALFMSAGGYHHHLGTNTWAEHAPRATESDARMLDWEIVLPSAADIDRAAESLRRAGVSVAREGEEWRAADPWGTGLRLTVGVR